MPQPQGLKYELSVHLPETSRTRETIARLHRSRSCGYDCRNPAGPPMRAGRIVLGLLVILILCGGAFFFWASWPELAAIQPPAKTSFDPAAVKRGGELVAIGNCITCHTRSDGKPLAGGRALTTPFGRIYATNITPDPDTGIGRWSQEAFDRAMRRGVDRRGEHLYPAFPYDHFTQLSENDLKAI